ncbi:hypothetical protein BCR42DRAFT_410622 [Absidia repens]|uniref:Invertebrate defensins family profile domain-containing protein n=1 Tax=Absidia repens TaxID=90262 RepID=A0A1X2IP97_9FUNG|nr:hypothetical protein BCR42DRAFT_410622 [Absidia repens]
MINASSFSSSCSLFLLMLLIVLFDVGRAIPMTDPCAMTTNEQQQLYSDEGMTGYSTQGCQEACAVQSWNSGDSNGMCVLDQCYCTDVGIGTCEDNNHEGCDAICQKLSLDWIGVCSGGACSCLF